jgi:hypothetical protein
MSQQFLEITDLTANATVDLMTGADQGEAHGRFHDQRPARQTLLLRATAAQAEVQVFAGNRQVVFPSPVCIGGVAATVPPRNTTVPMSWVVASNEITRVLIRETAGAGTVDIQGLLETTPLG